MRAFVVGSVRALIACPPGATDAPQIDSGGVVPFSHRRIQFDFTIDGTRYDRHLRVSSILASASKQGGPAFSRPSCRSVRASAGTDFGSQVDQRAYCGLWYVDLDEI